MENLQLQMLRNLGMCIPVWNFIKIVSTLYNTRISQIEGTGTSTAGVQFVQTCSNEEKERSSQRNR